MHALSFLTGRRILLILLFHSAVFCGYSTDLAPVEGGSINFQGMLVSSEGVPIGTNAAQFVCMRFAIVSEEEGFKPWLSPNLHVQVDRGLFMVRLGKFSGSLYEDVEPIDEVVFSQSQATQNERYLEVSIHPDISDISNQGCLNARVSEFLPFKREKINQTDLEPASLENNIKIPGVPFSVSSVRIEGDDTKEGTLRISRENNLPPAGADLQINAFGSYNGLEIIQNQNLGLIIRHVQPGNETALETLSGEAQIQGNLQLSGDESTFIIRKNLRSIHPTRGGTIQLQGNRLGPLEAELIAGDIFSPAYSNPLSQNFSASVTGESKLHKLRIVDALNTDESKTQFITVGSSGETRTFIKEDGQLNLGDQGFLSLSGREENRLELSGDNAAIEALGFYDQDQTETSSNAYPYQVVPHGLSVFNSITLGNSRQFSRVRLRGLIGEFRKFNNSEDFESDGVYFDSRNREYLHTHDLRVGADPGALIDKFKEAKSGRVIKKDRLDEGIAYLFENNAGLSTKRPFYFQKLNIFSHFRNE